MMTIGEFAQASGLTITALRFYGEKGLLEPRAVDPDTGYRQYAGSQVRRAVMIKLLRGMGLPLSSVAEIVDDPDRAAELLARFRRDLEADTGSAGRGHREPDSTRWPRTTSPARSAPGRPPSSTGWAPC